MLKFVLAGSIMTKGEHKKKPRKRECKCKPVSVPVRKIVPEVRTIDRDRLSVLETAHVFPNDLLVAERGPAVCLTLLDEFVK